MGERLSIVTECMGPTGVLYDQHREPTADDLVAWLQARPDLAVEVLDRAKIARAWVDEEYVSQRPAEFETAGVRLMGDGTWVWETCTLAQGREKSREAAKAACDAVLVAAGFALAGGAP